MVITVDDFDRVLRFYRDELGLPQSEEWDTDAGHGVLLDAGRATLEIFDRRQHESIDTLEAGRVTEGDVRLALRIDDVDATFHQLVVDGAPLMSHPIDAPWGDRIARLQTPHGMQLTLFTQQ
jgi:catechol 2,3-dioxygenase-like lactoylglutathione lyase family enzyme